MKETANALSESSTTVKMEVPTSPEIKYNPIEFVNETIADNTRRMTTNHEWLDYSTEIKYNPIKPVDNTIKNNARRMTTEHEWLDYVALNNALECGLINSAKLLLNNNCRVNLPSALYVPSSTPLHNAVLLQDIDLVDILLTKGALITAINCEGDSPLHLAFIRRQDKLVDLIMCYIEKHSNYDNLKNSQGLTHLHIASTRKNASIIENFLEAGANSQDCVEVDSPQWGGFTALHFAVEFNSPEAARVLKGSAESSCQTAMQLAYQKANELSIMVHMLSAENHNLHSGFFTYPSYFHFACMKDSPKVVEEFIKNGADVNTPISRDAMLCALYSPLHFAVESECLEKVKLLLKHGAVVKHRNGENMTALHLAMYHERNRDKVNYYDIVDCLYGALKNKEEYMQDNYGMSYLHIACTRNDVNLIKKCLDSNHDVNSRIQHNPRNFSHYTPLHFAVRYRFFQAVQLLIERGANVNANDINEAGTPLHLACEVGHAGIVELLLQHGASVNIIRDKSKKTVLHLLVESYMDRQDGASIESKLQLLPLVKRLVKLGANVNAKDEFNCTALHIACWKLVDGSQMVKKLLDAGANINLENNEGHTPLEMTYFESYCGNAQDYMMLYHHVQKLKLLGYKVISKNEGYCEVVMKEKDGWDPLHKEFKDKKIARKAEQRRNEIVKLKNVKLQNNAMTLYDLLVDDARNLGKFADDPIVKKIMEGKSLRNEYPVFANFLRLRYDKALQKNQKWDVKAVVAKPKSFKRQRLR